jgi:hypothetical protein
VYEEPLLDGQSVIGVGKAKDEDEADFDVTEDADEGVEGRDDEILELNHSLSISIHRDHLATHADLAVDSEAPLDVPFREARPPPTPPPTETPMTIKAMVATTIQKICGRRPPILPVLRCKTFSSFVPILGSS